MRIKNLNLVRYGHFKDHSLEFADTGITVVYGPNETGKSTSLSAISDMMYGFGHTSPYSFRYDYNQLRIESTLVNRAGAEIRFARRKRQKDALVAPDDSPLPGSALAPFLGQTTKDFFERSFGLSHQRLRQGGDAIGNSDGDLGKILFEAGSGITSLAEVQLMLEKEANAIFGSRKTAGRAIYQSEQAFQDAANALKETTVKAQDWQYARNELADARARLEGVRKELRDLTAHKARLNRWLRVLPLLRELDTLRAGLAAHGEEAALPADASERYTRAVEQRRHGRNLVAETEKALTHLLNQLSACTVDERLLEAGESVQRLYENVAGIEQGLAALPLLEAAIADMKKHMNTQAQRLNLPMAGDQPLVPRQPDITNLAEHVNRRQQLDTAFAKAKVDHDAAAEQVEQLEQELSALGVLTDPRADTAVLNQLTTELAATGDSSKTRKDIRKLDTRIEAGLAKLPWWTGDADSLLGATLPATSQVDQHRKAFDRSRKNIDTHTEKLDTATEDLESARHKLASYRERESFYTDEDLSQARFLRQQAWALVRQTLDGHPPPSPAEMERFGAGNELAPAYENLTTSADEIADSRIDSVEKLVEHKRLQQDVGEREHAVDTLTAKLKLAKMEHSRLMKDWQELWKPTNVNPDAPEIMREALTTVETIRDANAAKKELADDLADVEAHVEAIHQQLMVLASRLAVTTPAGISRELLAAHIQAALDQRSDAYKKAESLRTRSAEQKRVQTKYDRELAAHDEQFSEWQELWGGCCSALKLPADLSITQAREVARAWDELGRQTIECEHKQSELRQAQLLVSQFTEAATVLLTSAMPGIRADSPREAIAAVRTLHAEAVKMQQAAARRSQFEERKTQLDVALQQQRKSVATAEDDISALMEFARVTEEEELPSAITKAQARQRLNSNITGAQARLLEASEGENELSLRSAGEGLSLDDLRSELDGLAAEGDTLSQNLEETTRREEQARTAMEKLESTTGAHNHAQTMQNAMARMNMQARDYLRLQAATVLLRHGIERIRDKHKSPILDRASGFFAALTTGSFTRIAIDYEGDSPVIFGVRASDESVYTDGMSDGTRDQLYLALRLAFIENYCAAEEPLPFIGDDLFVHFDDERTSAGLKLLSSLANCQVILFTHHEHITDLARQTLGAQVSVLNLDAPVRLIV